MTIPGFGVCLLVGSLIATALSAWIFSLKLRQLMNVRRDRVNGPILVLATDKVRHHGLILALSASLVVIAVAALFVLTPTLVRIIMTTLILVSIAISVDAIFTNRRRQRIDELVSMYRGVPGGKRRTDPL